jgi:hypothetical protein
LQREWWRWEWRIKEKKRINKLVCVCVCVEGSDELCGRKQIKSKSDPRSGNPERGTLLDCPKRDSAICSFSFLLIVYPRKREKSFGISLSASREIRNGHQFLHGCEIERRRRRSIPPPVS